MIELRHGTVWVNPRAVLWLEETPEGIVRVAVVGWPGSAAEAVGSLAQIRAIIEESNGR